LLQLPEKAVHYDLLHASKEALTNLEVIRFLANAFSDP